MSALNITIKFQLASIAAKVQTDSIDKVKVESRQNYKRHRGALREIDTAELLPVLHLHPDCHCIVHEELAAERSENWITDTINKLKAAEVAI